MKSWALRPLSTRMHRGTGPGWEPPSQGPPTCPQGSVATTVPEEWPWSPRPAALPPSLCVSLSHLLAPPSLLSDLLSLPSPLTCSSCPLLSGPTPQNLRSCSDFHAESETKSSSDYFCLQPCRCLWGRRHMGLTLSWRLSMQCPRDICVQLAKDPGTPTGSIF